MSSNAPLTLSQACGPLTVIGDAKASIPARSLAQMAIIDSQALFGDSREIQILHNNRLYRLRITVSGKLILTA